MLDSIKSEIPSAVEPERGFDETLQQALGVLNTKEDITPEFQIKIKCILKAVREVYKIPEDSLVVDKFMQIASLKTDESLPIGITLKIPELQNKYNELYHAEKLKELLPAHTLINLVDGVNARYLTAAMKSKMPDEKPEISSLRTLLKSKMIDTTGIKLDFSKFNPQMMALEETMDQLQISLEQMRSVTKALRNGVKEESISDINLHKFREKYSVILQKILPRNPQA